MKFFPEKFALTRPSNEAPKRPARMDELKSLIENVENLKYQQEDIQFIKEKQEYILKNFPTLENNIVEKIKGSEAKSLEEIVGRLEILEEKERKRNIWNKVLLIVSTVSALFGAGGVVIIILYLAEII
ncbi:MAG: hypothetical protein K5858_02135 [Lachnospiraceae bacterium]|jgi:hypothetical protein|nr:hypothetical protein [Lachnospiraceae bacterium]